MAESQPPVPQSSSEDPQRAASTSQQPLDDDAATPVDSKEDSSATLTQSQSHAQPAPSGADNTASSSDLPASLQSTEPASTTMASTSSSAQAAAQPSAPEITEARVPQKKDATLREFLSRMDAHAPIIPDAVTNHYLTLAGLPPPPQTSPHLARLLALATQKFVADVAADAYQYARIRSSHTTSNTANALMATGQAPIPGAPALGAVAGAGVGGAGSKPGDKGPALGLQRPGYGGGGQGGQQGRTVLTMEDLGMAVGEYGVNVKRGEFYR